MKYNKIIYIILILLVVPLIVNASVDVLAGGWWDASLDELYEAKNQINIAILQLGGNPLNGEESYVDEYLKSYPDRSLKENITPTPIPSLITPTPVPSLITPTPVPNQIVSTPVANLSTANSVPEMVSNTSLSNGYNFNYSETPNPGISETTKDQTGGNVNQYAMCIANNVNIRKMPNKSSQSIAKISKGENVYIQELCVDQSGETWCLISIKGNKTGYIMGKYIQIVSEVPKDKLISHDKIEEINNQNISITKETETNKEKQSTNTQKQTVEKKQVTGKASKKQNEKETKSAYKKECKTVDYIKVSRNPDNYKGKKIKVSGKVIQVSEGWGSSVTIRLQESRDKIWYVTYSRDKGEERILEDDRITVYGECNGVESYTTIFGATVTIPSVSAKYYELKK